MEIGFDVIGDLFLSPHDTFNWDGKPTSLYCIVAGNISNDIGKVQETLEHISDCYKGVFYVSGGYEFHKCSDIRDRVIDINNICARIGNVSSLWHHVVILESIAILGCNGWSNNVYNSQFPKALINELHFEDVLYLKGSIKKLQKHGDVKDIVVVTSSVPKKELYFGENPEIPDRIALGHCIKNDTENKIRSWVFGSYEKDVDIVHDDVRFVNNPYRKNLPYWPKRLSLNF